MIPQSEGVAFPGIIFKTAIKQCPVWTLKDIKVKTIYYSIGTKLKRNGGPVNASLSLNILDYFHTSCFTEFQNMTRNYLFSLLIELCREKTGFCICENKDAEQLRGKREADQRLCFRYSDTTILLLPKYEISGL